MTLMTMTSCQSASAPEPHSSVAAAAPTPVPDIHPKQNPAPREAYALQIEFAGLPASVTELTGTADFEVANRDAVPLDHSKALGGVRLPPQHSVPLVFRRIDDTRFAASFQKDALLDEDYFGLGVCEWSLTSVSVHFRSPVTHFVGGFSGDRLHDGVTVVQHYLVRDFSEKPASMDQVFGEESADFYRPAAGPQFTLTISARREAQ